MLPPCSGSTLDAANVPSICASSVRERVFGRAGPLLRQHRWRGSPRLGRPRSLRPRGDHRRRTLRPQTGGGTSRVRGARGGWLAGPGVGAALTPRLIDEARGNGVGSFYALVKAGNKRMLSVLRHLDLPERERVEDGGGRAVLRRKPTYGVRALALTPFYALQALRVSDNHPAC
jgi:hypothetical protein